MSQVPSSHGAASAAAQLLPLAQAVRYMRTEVTVRCLGGRRLRENGREVDPGTRCGWLVVVTFQSVGQLFPPPAPGPVAVTVHVEMLHRTRHCSTRNKFSHLAVRFFGAEREQIVCDCFLVFIYVGSFFSLCTNFPEDVQKKNGQVWESRPLLTEFLTWENSGLPFAAFLQQFDNCGILEKYFPQVNFV